MQEQVRVQLQGVWYELEQTETGKYTITLSAPDITSYGQDGGGYALEVEALESHGLPSTETHSLIVKETQPPDIAFLSPQKEYIADSNPEIKITVTDEKDGSGIDAESTEIALDGGLPQKGESYTLQNPLAEGRHIVIATARDNDGNAAQKTMEFVVDTIPPALVISEPETDINTNRGVIAVRGKASDETSGLQTVEMLVNGELQNNLTVATDGSFYQLVQLKSENNQITIRAKDKAENLTEKSVTVYSTDGWIDPIWWRTKEDEKRATKLRNKVKEVKIRGLTPDEQLEWMAGLLACLNPQDRNRIEYDTKWLYERLYQAGYGFGPKNHKTDWAEKDYPYAEEMERIRSNVQGLIDTYYPQGAALPESIERPTCEDINAVERILYEMKGMIELMEQSYTYCGVPYCGQGVSL